MLKKRVLLVVGVILTVVSVIITIYVGMVSLRGAMFDLEGIFLCMSIIGCLMIVGMIIIVFSVQKENRRKIILSAEIAILLIYGVIIFALVLGGFRLIEIGLQNNQSLLEYIKFNSNFIPFKTIHYYVTCFFSGQINRNIVIENLAGNFMMFMPMGFLLPAIFKKQKKRLYFLVTLTSMLIGIEIIQLVFRLGKFDIDDFILGMIGACLIYAIIRIGIIKRFLNKTMLI